MKRWFASGILIALMIVSVAGAVSPANAQDGNRQTCVENYDESVDYFPDKVEPVYAEGFSVEYFNHYKIVTVLEPWPGATEDDQFQYVLVQCGTPSPDGLDDAQVVEIPGGDIIAMSTTQLPHLAQLDLLDHLIGLDSFLYANTPEVVTLIESGELIEVGSGPTVNVEVVLDAEPDIVMSFSSGVPEYDPLPTLLSNDVAVVINAEWVESSPLGRAEWIKFTSMFFNKEAEANTYFAATEAEYNALVDLTDQLSDNEKPLVLTGTYTTFGDAWNIAGTDSYNGQFLRDAGARQVLADNEDVQGSTGSVLFDFETVYLEGLEADFWLPNVFGVSTLDDLLALDERYGDFLAVDEDRVYNSSARVNANGGNDLFESGVIQPQVILADLIKIFHPDLLPDHELVYHEQLR